MQNCIINHTRIKMSTEMKRETVGWQHVAAAPPHTHTLNGKERGREREGHAHLHPFAVSQVISGNSCSCTAAIGTGFGKGTVSVTGDWGRDLVEVFPAGLATSNIYKQIKFASEFHLSCFATIVCGRSVCMCVCVCAPLLLQSFSGCQRG